MSYVRFLLCLPVLIALAVTDYKTHTIPKKYWMYLLCVGVGYSILAGQQVHRMVLDALALGVPLWMIFILSKGKMLGGGDVKLMAAAGVLLGTTNGYRALLLSLFIALVTELPRYRKGRAFALGPYLAMGIGICLFF
ncbi:Type IV leader peptidase family protein [Lachnospiraceae bacterium XBB1006]|nr:Type IV leader peptidase family protein [Lachnospiraceae bacterium XBB1006]